MFRFRHFSCFRRPLTSNSHRNNAFHGRIRTLSSDTKSEDSFKDKKVILERNFYVNPSSNNSFNIRTHFMNVRLKSAQLESNLFRISVFKGEDNCDSDHGSQVIGGVESDLSRVGVKCHVDSEGKNVTVTGTGVESDPSTDRFVLQLQLPVNSNVEIEADDVTLAPMHLKKIKCHLRNGVFRFRNLKCEDLDLTSDNGSVVFEGFVLGNVQMALKGNGSIDGELCQGTNVKLLTENGSIRVKALYCNGSEIRSKNGTVHIENLTGRRSTVSVQEGDANIVCLDGSIDLCVNKGNANVYVSQNQLNPESTIRSEEGNVKVSFSESVESWVRFEGRELNIQDGIEGETMTNTSKHSTVFRGMLSKSKLVSGPMITVLAPNGIVTVEILDWFQRITMGSE